MKFLSMLFIITTFYLCVFFLRMQTVSFEMKSFLGMINYSINNSHIIYSFSYIVVNRWIINFCYKIWINIKKNHWIDRPSELSIRLKYDRLIYIPNWYFQSTLFNRMLFNINIFSKYLIDARERYIISIEEIFYVARISQFKLHFFTIICNF